MKTLFLDHTGALGGAELFLLEVARRLGGARVILFSDGPFRLLLEKAKVPVDVLEASATVAGVGRAGKGLAQLRALPAVVRLARRVAKEAASCDVVFANSQKALAVGAVAAALARKPLVWYLHDIITAEHFSAINRRVCVFLANRFARRIMANSVASREAFVGAGGKPKKVSVVYNGLDAAAFPPSAADEQGGLRSVLGLVGVPVVAVFSRLAPWKGQHVLLDALAKLPGVHGLLVGAPLFGDDAAYEQSLRAQAARLGIGGRVHFLGFREDIPALLQAVDIVAHTSVSPEPFGRVIVEGMLARKPVVATRAGGACEILEDGVTGRLVTPGDADELARVLADLLAHPEKAASMAAAAVESALQRFSVASMLSGIQQELDRAIRGDKP